MIIVKTEDISSAIKQAKVMIRPGSLILENSLRFSAKKDKLYIRTNSGGIKFITRIPCTCDREVDFMVNIHLISSTLPFFLSKSLEILPDAKKETVLFKSKELQVEIKTIPLAVWASYKIRSVWNIDISVGAETLVSLVNRTAYASDTKDSTDNRAMLNFSVTSDEKGLKVTGLDFYRSATCATGKINDLVENSFTIPTKTLKVILPYLKGTVHLKKYGNEYAISTETMELYGHTPAIDYYDISTLLEKCPEDSVMIDKDYFLRYCEVAAIVNKMKIFINIQEEYLEVSASGNGGKVENKIETKSRVKATYCVNPVFIMDVLKKCPEKKIKMYYSRYSTKPLFFKGDDHIDMVMPIQN